MKILSLISVLLFSVSTVLACHGGEVDKGVTPKPGDKTKLYCLTNSDTTCAFIWFQSVINSTAPGKFILKFPQTNLNGNDVKIDLWMNMGNGHGHGSAPLKVTEIALSTYQIEEAYFIMQGEWVVRVQFTFNGILERLEIPVYVSE